MATPQQCVGAHETYRVVRVVGGEGKNLRCGGCFWITETILLRWFVCGFWGVWWFIRSSVGSVVPDAPRGHLD